MSFNFDIFDAITGGVSFLLPISYFMVLVNLISYDSVSEFVIQETRFVFYFVYFSSNRTLEALDARASKVDKAFPDLSHRFAHSVI